MVRVIRMDLRQLNTFLTLSKLKNFTRTAEHFGYAQSSITAQIKQLENELNVKLFERIGKHVSLTQAGNALLPYAAQMVSLSADIREALSPSDAASGRIAIGAAESVCIYRLPRIIRSYKARHPNVDLHLKLLTCDQFIPMLSDNSIDLAFTIGEKLRDASVVSRFACREPVMILSHPDHALASRPSVTPQDFAEESFILTQTGCDYRRAFERDMRSAGIRPKVVLETGSIQAIKEMAMSGLGLCVLPQIAVAREVAEKKLIALAYRTDDPMFSQLIYHRDKWISPLLADFITVAEHDWPDPDGSIPYPRFVQDSSGST